MSLSGLASPRARDAKRMILSGQNRSAIRRTRSSKAAGFSATSLIVIMITRTAPANLVPVIGDASNGFWPHRRRLFAAQVGLQCNVQQRRVLHRQFRVPGE